MAVIRPRSTRSESPRWMHTPPTEKSRPRTSTAYGWSGTTVGILDSSTVHCSGQERTSSTRPRETNAGSISAAKFDMKPTNTYSQLMYWLKATRVPTVASPRKMSQAQVTSTATSEPTVIRVVNPPWKRRVSLYRANPSRR